ncbi:50S ribosomal protein L13 [Patescibacteria group bacterium]|nr:50S ribosomal protein L13 [Patescibacteria group bacterium]
MNTMQNTKFVSSSQITRNWFLIDASDKRVGVLASKITSFLIGKGKPQYSSNLNFADNVVVLNAGKVEIHDRKKNSKVYTRYSGYPGGLKKITYDKMMERNPKYIIEHAVFGMLPKNKRGEEMKKYLHVFVDDKHNLNKNIKFTEIKW